MIPLRGSIGIRLTVRGQTAGKDAPESRDEEIRNGSKTDNNQNLIAVKTNNVTL